MRLHTIAYAEHEEQIIVHKASKKAFDSIQGKLPTIKALSAEYSEVLSEKQRAYAEYRESQDHMRELLTVKANIDTVTERPDPEHLADRGEIFR